MKEKRREERRIEATPAEDVPEKNTKGEATKLRSDAAAATAVMLGKA